MKDFVCGLSRRFSHEALPSVCSFELGSLETDALNVVAVVHTELILVHPFREGNGRVARLFAILMASQAGLPPLDFSEIAKKHKRRAYFSAVQAGMGRNYHPMEKIFSAVIQRTFQTSEGESS